ncbi:MAG: sensor histidine kinase [Limnochordia bacterium]|jgi:two-component system sensor histidine kinase DegS|nr:histidine kinase [Bacillota bacterium]
MGEFSSGQNYRAIEDILRETIQALRHGKEEVFQIADAAWNEYRRLQQEFESVRAETAAAVALVDELEPKSRRARLRLLQVNRDFYRYSEQEIKDAYETAHRLMSQLAAARDREALLRRRRDELERALINIADLAERADGIVSRVGAAMEYLLGDLEGATKMLADWKQKSEMANRIIKAQEEERKRVAREIHDGPAQSLANLVLRMEICERLLDQDVDEAVKELGELKKTAKGSLTELRRIIFDLRPMALDDLGLVPALRRYLEDLRDRLGLPVELVILGEEVRLDLNQEVTLFRLAQEAVNNARKHAQAKAIRVRLEFAPFAVTLVVEDDGRGFTPSETGGLDGFGLLGMRERAELVDGDLEVTSAPGQGTRVRVRVPLAKE